ncbi:MAG: hypothetical protein GF419_06905 [Ignavibacteriales bacterium]|nr:hypothetical protein [Ignavibacteriales bacterium]
MRTYNGELEPLFEYNLDETEHFLYETDCEISKNDSDLSVTLPGKVYLSTAFASKILIKLSYERDIPLLDSINAGNDVQIKMNDVDLRYHVISARKRIDYEIDPGEKGHKSTRFTLALKNSYRIKPYLRGNADTRVKSLIFHLFNLPKFIGPRLSEETYNGANEEGGYVVSVATLRNDKWNIAIKSMRQTEENIKGIKEVGGSAITHVGKIEAVNGDEFTGKEAYELIVALGYMFSFISGLMCFPINPIGFDAKNQPVLEATVFSTLPFQKRVNNWFSGSQSNIKKHCNIESLFSGFMKKWKEKETSGLRAVCSFYWNAFNYSGGIDHSLVLFQAIMERLFSEHKLKANKNNAYSKFEKLCEEFRIPLEIPQGALPLYETIDKYIECKKRAQASNSENKRFTLAGFLTSTRNSSVHSSKSNQDDEGCQYPKGGRLAATFLWQYFAELFILRHCDYNGRFNNIMTNKIETVPWAQSNENEAQPS